MIASQNPDIRVTIVDLSAQRIAAWQSNALPIHEPQLLDMVRSARDAQPNRPANLFFSTDIDAAIAEADCIFVSVHTPSTRRGRGPGRAPELSWFESAMRRIAAVATSDKIVVEKSTVPVRTAETMAAMLQAHGGAGVRFEILSNPEFLAEGTAIANLLQPDRVVVGAAATATGARAAAALVDVYAAWVPRAKILTTSWWSAELAKLAANCLLAQRISSINALSALCEQTGADVVEVARVCGQDSRIGPQMLSASLGYGGSCFTKDIRSMAYMADALHLPAVAAYWQAIDDLNEDQKRRFARRIVAGLRPSLALKKIAIFGFAFKKDTGDVRASAAIRICHDLLVEGAALAIYDPQAAPANIWRELEAACGGGGDGDDGDDGDDDDPSLVRERVSIHHTPYEAARDADAVVIATDWDEFGNKTAVAGVKRTVVTPPDTPRAEALDAPFPHARPRVDWEKVASRMRRPMYVFDGRNMIEPRSLEDLGFRVEGIGMAGGGRPAGVGVGS